MKYVKCPICVKKDIDHTPPELICHYDSEYCIEFINDFLRSNNIDPD